MQEKITHRAAAYLRVSTEQQAELSPDAQLREITRYARANAIKLLPDAIFIDAGFSGRDVSHRPAFQKMAALVRSGRADFDMILVHKFDRFARSRCDSIVYKSLFAQFGVRVCSITESIDDGGSGMGMLLEAITEAYAEFYSINLGREVKKGMTEKARRGGLQATPAYGYQVQQHMLVPKAPEDDYVRRLFEAFLSGASMLELARWMNAEGQRTHRGGLFESRTIAYLLQNPVYTGHLRWNPTEPTGRRFDHPDLIIAPAAHTPLVDAALFDRVQEKIQEQKKTPPARPAGQRRHWLCGIVRCASCGSGLVWAGDGFLRCGGYARGRCSSAQRVPAAALEEAFFRQLRCDALPQPVKLSWKLCSPAPLQPSLTAQVQQLRRRQKRLQEAFLSGVQTLEEYRQTKAELDRQLQTLQTQLASFAQQDDDAQKALHRRITATLQTLQAPECSIAQKYEAACQLLQDCRFDKARNRLQLVYRARIPELSQDGLWSTILADN